MNIGEAKRPGGVTGKGFRPGVSGNPGGRPKGRSITARLREALESNRLGNNNIKEGKTVLDLVVEAILTEAAAGNARIIKELLDRIEGKVATAAPEVDVFANLDVRGLTDAELLAVASGKGLGGTGIEAEEATAELRDLAPSGESGTDLGLAAPCLDPEQIGGDYAGRVEPTDPLGAAQTREVGTSDDPLPGVSA